MAANHPFGGAAELGGHQERMLLGLLNWNPGKDLTSTTIANM
jgi:hypothetical protein